MIEPIEKNTKKQNKRELENEKKFIEKKVDDLRKQRNGEQIEHKNQNETYLMNTQIVNVVANIPELANINGTCSKIKRRHQINTHVRFLVLIYYSFVFFLFSRTIVSERTQNIRK